jgi:hypothetical protein
MYHFLHRSLQLVLITSKTIGLIGEVYWAQHAFHYYPTTSVGKISRSEKYVATLTLVKTNLAHNIFVL